MTIYTDTVEVHDASPVNANTLITKEYSESKTAVYYIGSVNFKATGITKIFTTMTGK